jgi:hypothetical protein
MGLVAKWLTGTVFCSESSWKESSFTSFDQKTMKSDGQFTKESRGCPAGPRIGP